MSERRARMKRASRTFQKAGRSFDAVAEIGSAIVAFGAYRTSALPLCRSLVGDWDGRARSIPDPELRDAAVTALADKRGNVEAVAVLATLAPRAHRPSVVAACTLLQIAVDYLDTLGERSTAPDRLQDGLTLHRALSAALGEEPGDEDWYSAHPRGEDGGYLASLVHGCGSVSQSLPAAAVALPHARAAARRCGEGQSLVHAGGEQLRPFAEGLGAPPMLRWWEAAAGASSSVAAHALLALAGTPGASAEEAAWVEEAYDPWVGALTVLLDDLIDREADTAEGEHNYMAYYRDDAEAADRIDLLAAGARSRLARLPRRHRAILAGVLSHYLGTEAGAGSLPRPPRVAEAPAVRALTGLGRLR